ncbi:hypothetical protein SDC9_181983 [bioreactor metagenome]|uniref:Uncharacterized protein n=1 Tax=bioreactor metagenome TaxID=1076179 RepID=A0A645H8S1_9ZZZZ
MRRGQLCARLRVVEHEAVPIGKPRIEPNPLARKPLVEKQNQFSRFFRGDFARAVVGHRRIVNIRFAGERHKVAAIGHIRLRQINAEACRFQRRTPRIILLGIITEHGEVCRVAAGFHAVRHGLHKPKFTILRKLVHVRVVGYLQRGFPAEGFHRPIRHSVA